MKVSRAQSEKNKEAVVDAGARLLRERGLEGIGLSELMQSVGLTHGGFYKKFASKDDLIRQSCAQALATNRLKGTNLVAHAKKKPLASFVESYLSPRHREAMGRGCGFAALGAEAARSPDTDLRRIFADELARSIDLLEGILSENPDAATHDKATTIFSTMVGALVLSRLAESAAEGDRILAAAAASVLACAPDDQ